MIRKKIPTYKYKEVTYFKVLIYLSLYKHHK